MEIGRYTLKASAEAAVKDLDALGLPAFTHTASDGTFVVQVGPYLSQREAVATQKLMAAKYPKSLVRTLQQ